MDMESAKLLGAGIAVLGVIGSGIGIGSIFAAFISAVGRNPEAREHVFTMTMLGFALVEALALFALIIAILLFRQNTTFLQVIGLLAGFIGLLIFIGLDEIRVVFFPVTLCLIGAFCYAYSNNVLFKLNHINSSALASATMLSGFVFSIPLFLSEPQSFSFDLSLKTYLATLFLGLVSTGISFIAYVVLLQRSSPVQASSIIFLVPITGIFWGAIFLNENIDQKVILGSLCILVGIGLTNIFKPKKLLRD